MNTQAIKWISMGAVIDAVAESRIQLGSPDELEAFVSRISWEVESLWKGTPVLNASELSHKIIKGITWQDHG